ncbi:MAG: ferritin-like domain-containing protein [Chloroflexota bacterium]|nr:ferritin-like domain-containing protein [Chloroflexota bacterium]
MNPKDLVIAWLNDAHAMENALVQVLEHRVNDAKDYPAVQAMDQQHLEETRRHAEQVKGCIERLGGNVSSVKSVIGTLFGTVQAPMTGLARDEIVKNALVDYAAENFEVASYRALIAAATEVGDLETAAVCEQIMREDQAMAERIQQSLPGIVNERMRELAGNRAG